MEFQHWLGARLGGFIIAGTLVIAFLLVWLVWTAITNKSIDDIEDSDLDDM